MTSKLEIMTFPSSGRQVTIRRISPLLAMEVSRKIEQPKPPLEEIDLGDNKKSLEENPNAPSYIKALEEYNQKLQDLTLDLIVKRGVIIQLSDEEIKEVKDLKKQMKDDFGVELTGNDVYVYVKHVLMQTAEDITMLTEKVMGISQPSAKEVAEAQKFLGGETKE